MDLNRGISEVGRDSYCFTRHHAWNRRELECPKQATSQIPKVQATSSFEADNRDTGTAKQSSITSKKLKKYYLI